LHDSLRDLASAILALVNGHAPDPDKDHPLIEDEHWCALVECRLAVTADRSNEECHMDNLMRTAFSPLVLGEDDHCIEIGGLILTKTIRQPGLTLPPHSHQYANIGLVVEGYFTETVGRHSCEVTSTSLILRPAGEPHANQYGRAEARCLIIEVKPPRLEMVRQISPVLDRTDHLRGSWVMILARRIAQELRMCDSASPLAIEALTLELLARAARHNPEAGSSPEPRWLRQARELIHEQFTQPLGLSQIAESVGVHPAHLARMFRRYYKCSVGDYLRRLRLDTAAEELIRSDKSLAEIAQAAGFYDQSHFTHSFKRHIGLTPTEFRAAAGDTNTKRR
jgi:AraC family transcriptional regulator